MEILNPRHGNTKSVTSSTKIIESIHQRKTLANKISHRCPRRKQSNKYFWPIVNPHTRKVQQTLVELKMKTSQRRFVADKESRHLVLPVDRKWSQGCTKDASKRCSCRNHPSNVIGAKKETWDKGGWGKNLHTPPKVWHWL